MTREPLRICLWFDDDQAEEAARFYTGGGEPSVCGWPKDRYGVSWQVVPAAFYTMAQDKDEARKERVTAAMLAMDKFDIDALEKAYAGE